MRDVFSLDFSSQVAQRINDEQFVLAMNVRQANQCIHSAALRMKAALGNMAKIKVFMIHTGQRVDLALIRPYGAVERKIVQNILHQPLEFLPEWGAKAADSGFYHQPQGLMAQVASRHRSALATQPKTINDTNCELHNAAGAMRFVFSTILLTNHPEWLDIASDAQPAKATMALSINNEEIMADIRCLEPSRYVEEHDDTDVPPNMTVH